MLMSIVFDMKTLPLFLAATEGRDDSYRRPDPLTAASCCIDGVRDAWCGVNAREAIAPCVWRAHPASRAPIIRQVRRPILLSTCCRN
jgi:hypothetical protein